MSNPILNSLSIEAERLSEAIQSSNPTCIRTSIEALVSKKVTVNIQISRYLYECSIHSHYSPGEQNKFDETFLIPSSYCAYNHRSCQKCLSAYVQAIFSEHYLQNTYDCPGCYNLYITDSRLFGDWNLEVSLRYFMGDQAINNILYPPTPPPQLSIVLYANSYCDTGCGSSESVIICQIGHKFCINCLGSWVQTLVPPDTPISCPIQACPEPINAKNLTDALAKTNLLYPIKEKLWAIGMQLTFCFNCKIVVKLDESQDFTTCTCGSKVCSVCGLKDHFGFTCFYMISDLPYAEIPLSPPRDPNRCESVLEFEYMRARYAFNNFVNPGSNLEFKSAVLIVNKALEDRYSKKKVAMELQCGGRQQVNEVFIWHGSPEANYKNIMQNGLLVGGVDGIPVAVGTACGYGVYSATTPNTPIGYAKGSKKVMCCLAMKGINSTQQIRDIAQLNNGKTHSYAHGVDWVIFFTKEQILPRYLVEYKTKGT